MQLRFPPYVHQIVIDYVVDDMINGFLAVCCSGNIESVQMLLNLGLIKAARSRGYEALRRASKGGHAPVVELLIKTGLTAKDVSSDDAILALQYASMYGYVDVVRLLLGTGLTAQDLRRCRDVIQHASRNGHGSVVRLLLEAGLTVDDVRSQNNAALRLASGGGHAYVVWLLLRSGLTPKDVHSSFALTVAVACNHTAVIQLLWDHLGVVDSNQILLGTLLLKSHEL